ncbi:MAG TPA: hypothetical protein VK149_09675 [Sideroxyarcus sp.]|nr:hypothetical protein [Sideroxyarcus sp.]
MSINVFGVHVSDEQLGNAMTVFLAADAVAIVLLLIYLWKFLMPHSPRFNDFINFSRWKWRMDFVSGFAGLLMFIALILLPLATILLIMHFAGDTSAGANIKF